MNKEFHKMSKDYAFTATLNTFHTARSHEDSHFKTVEDAQPSPSNRPFNTGTTLWVFQSLQNITVRGQI